MITIPAFFTGLVLGLMIGYDDGIDDTISQQCKRYEYSVKHKECLRWYEKRLK